jgi:hypothetical protein
LRISLFLQVCSHMVDLFTYAYKRKKRWAYGNCRLLRLCLHLTCKYSSIRSGIASAWFQIWHSYFTWLSKRVTLNVYIELLPPVVITCSFNELEYREEN